MQIGISKFGMLSCKTTTLRLGQITTLKFLLVALWVLTSVKLQCDTVRTNDFMSKMAPNLTHPRFDPTS